MRSKTAIFLFSVLGFAASVALHYQRLLDWRLQGFFAKQGHWLIDESEPIGKFLFYRAPKALLIAYGVLLLVLAVRSFRKKSPTRWGYIYSLLCMALIPFLIGLGKKLTNEPCPGELFVFFGNQHLGNLRGECFPGGHASGGFALLHLYWCSAHRRRWLVPGIFIGGAMGIYQMAKGAHFLSDTTASFFFALALSAALATLWRDDQRQYLIDLSRSSL